MSAAAKLIAVAGGTGFLGRQVVSRSLAAGYRVRVLARGELPPELAGAESRRCDLLEPVDAELLAGCDVLVNLVGIKRAGAAGWEPVHVELPRRLAEAAEAAGVEELIHVSVAGCEGATAADGPYLHSKARGEEQLQRHEGQLRVTVLRPGVVYGPGDDMLRNLADSIRAAPVFPAPAGGRAQVQPVAVEDVADAVLRCIERPGSSRRSYTLVGPERLTLAQLVARVAASSALARSCRVVWAPLAVQRLVAAVLERVADDPLITRAQLGLLTRGVVGDPEPARADLGWSPRPLDEAAILAALEAFQPRLPSVRLVPDPKAAAELTALAGESSPTRLGLFAVLAVTALLLGPLLSGTVWLRMAGLELVLLSVALALLPLRWAELLRPRPAALAAGAAAGVVMWAGAFGVAAALRTLAPQLWAESASIYAWVQDFPLPLALTLLTVIVFGEEIVWRGVLGVGLLARIGPWAAVLTSAALFTIAHLSTGPPVLALAAFLAGGAWTYLAIRTRSLFASLVAHLGWDVTMLWLTPLS